MFYLLQKRHGVAGPTPYHLMNSCVFFFFFFFYWRYNPLCVLAFSVIFFHSALSSHCFLHRLTPIICKSSSMPAVHLFHGLPLVLVPIGFHCNILLGVLLSSLRITWPSQAILQLFMNLAIYAFPISLVHNSFWFSRIHLHFSCVYYFPISDLK